MRYISLMLMAFAGCREVEPATTAATATASSQAKPVPAKVAPATEPPAVAKPIAAAPKAEPAKPAPPTATELQGQRYATYVKTNGPPKEFHGELKVGMFGRFDLRGVSVYKAVDASSVIIRHYVVEDMPEPSRAGGVSRRSRTIERHLFVTGIDASGVVDDSPCKLPGLFEVAGTYTYKTAIGGQRTILKIERVAAGVGD